MRYFALLLAFTCTTLYGQDFQTLEENNDFEGMTQFAKRTDELNDEQIFMVGFAFFQLDNDKDAVKMYREAIDRGYETASVYFYMGLSQRLMSQFKEARASQRKAVQLDPVHQAAFTEIGNTFYYEDAYDSALVYFKKARELPFQFAESYFKVPHVYALIEDYDQALKEYYISASMVDPTSMTYAELQNEIGRSEFVHSKDYAKSIAAYKTSLAIDSTQIQLYSKLSKSLYANEQYEEGEALYQKLRAKFQKKELNEEMMEMESVCIAEFEFNGHTILYYRSFLPVEETLDIMYRIYQLSEDGESIERRLMTEKTMKFTDDSADHLLCERESNGTHHTYLYGWQGDDIPFDSLKNAVEKVLEGELKPGASSSFSTGKKKKKKKRKDN